MKKHLIILMLCLPFLSKAQDAYTLKFLPQLQQSQWGNASNQTDAKISVGIPVLSGVSFFLYNSGFSYHSIFKQVNDSTTQVSPGKFIDKLRRKNLLGFGATVSLFSINYAKEDYSVGFSINDKAYLQFNYPKDLLKLLWYGNGPYIGQTLNIGNFGLNAAWYREYALHFTKNYKKWTFGASPKLLFGKTNINTASSSLDLYTAPDYYAIKATADMNLQTSGIADSADKANNSTPTFSKYMFNSKNVGLGLDIGAKYQYSEKITIAAGINNLGYISWKSQVHNYVSGQSEIQFDGFKLEDFLQGDSDLVSTSKFIDTVRQLVKFNKNSESYKSYLPYEAFVMGNYTINDHHAVGLQINTERYYHKNVFAGTLCYQLMLGKHFSGALSYTAKSNAAFNLGGGIVLRFAGMQWYFATDNWWASIKPLDSKNTNFHFGMNLVFGNSGKKKPSETYPGKKPKE